MEFEDAREALTEIADSLPREIFRELNGGVLLLEDVVRDRHGFYILGHYHYHPHGLGRYISIYYGSVMELFGHTSRDYILKKLKETLYHELTHHIEHLAGDKTLERQDEIDIARMLQGGRPRP
ncbi:MAG: hypothetical protein FWE34_05645 [Defluviitaleaceae bacterium]|nr:hypothetical protein [Defluviitaleaceae bacterium]